MLYCSQGGGGHGSWLRVSTASNAAKEARSRPAMERKLRISKQADRPA